MPAAISRRDSKFVGGGATKGPGPEKLFLRLRKGERKKAEHRLGEGSVELCMLPVSR